jgi:ribosome maturation factor RimP
MSAVADRVERTLIPVVAAEGFDLEAVDVQPAGRRRLVRVLVDCDGGVTLDHIAKLTPVLSQALDDADAMGEQPYVLEVSSPGVDRPLTLPRHWRRNAGRLVTLTLHEGAPVSGRIGDSDDRSVTVLPTDASGAPITLAYDAIASAHIEVEFGHPTSTAVDGPEDDA